MFGKKLLIGFTVRVFLERFIIFCMFFPFRCEGGMWDLIVVVPDHCLSLYYTYNAFCKLKVEVFSSSGDADYILAR